jgi:OmpA-OmpF porin, OOP family
MRKLVIALVSLVAIGAATARAEQTAPVDYDCALFNECGDGGGPQVDRGKTKGFSMLGTTSAAAVGKPASRPAAAPQVARPRPAPAPAPQLKAARPMAVGAMSAASGVDLQMTFFSGSDELTPGARAGADRLAAAMLRPDRLTTRFRIEGHTDAVGTRESNLELSLRRARALVGYLAAKGVETSRFEVVGLGFDQPMPGTAPRAAINRRVVAKPIK